MAFEGLNYPEESDDMPKPLLNFTKRRPAMTNAIAFADWLMANRFYPHGDGKWTDGLWVKTTEELYEIFQNQGG